jgi:hypothetical protein
MDLVVIEKQKLAPGTFFRSRCTLKLSYQS